MKSSLQQLLFQEKGLSAQIFFYICSGLSVAAVQFLTFAVCLKFLQQPYLVATTIASLVAIVTSFLLQRYVTFAKSAKRERTTHHSFILFIVNSGLSLCLNFLIMYTGVDLLLLNSYLAQVISMTILALYNFAMYRFIFR